jgi:hypothetical protein
MRCAPPTQASPIIELRLGVQRVLVAERENSPAESPGTAATPDTGCATCTGSCAGNLVHAAETAEAGPITVTIGTAS